MSAYKELRDICNNFEYDLQKVSAELFSAKIRPTFTDAIEQKLKDLALFSSKQKLLKTIPLSYTQQVLDRANDTSLIEYGEVASWKALEQHAIKSLGHTHAVKLLLTTPDSDLDTQMLERKHDIAKALLHYRDMEIQLYRIKSLLEERESELSVITEKSYLTYSELGQMRVTRRLCDKDGLRGPLFEKLATQVAKLEMMRWLLGRLACPRGPYDWIEDRNNQISSLPLTRIQNTIKLFTQ